uniref:Phospholipid scramblase n=1 Tax=Paramormyrops kingsleyae TaxID=1676925 RepID=A0A3B3SAI3_9TELE
MHYDEVNMGHRCCRVMFLSSVMVSGVDTVVQTLHVNKNVCLLRLPTQVDQLLIKQRVELIEALAGFESNNKYEIRNSLGQNVFFAVEENDCLSRQCCGPLRSFTIRVLDNFGHEVITITRPLKCTSCLFPCCLQEMEVQSPPGNTVGYVLQQWHPIFPKFIIENERREQVLKLHGPFCGWSCLPDVDFEVTALSRTPAVVPANSVPVRPRFRAAGSFC